MKNKFTNLAVWLTGPRRQLGGIRIFYSSSILWDSESSSFRVKLILLTPTVGSRDHILPESHSIQMIAYFTRRSRRYSPINFRDPVCPLSLQFSTTDKSLWITTYTCHSYNYFPVALVITRYPGILSDDPIIPLCLLLCSFFRMNTHTNNSSHLPGIHSTPVPHAFRKVLHNANRSFNNPLQPITLETLDCLHYD